MSEPADGEAEVARHDSQLPRLFPGYPNMFAVQTSNPKSVVWDIR